MASLLLMALPSPPDREWLNFVRRLSTCQHHDTILIGESLKLMLLLSHFSLTYSRPTRNNLRNSDPTCFLRTGWLRVQSSRQNGAFSQPHVSAHLVVLPSCEFRSLPTRRISVAILRIIVFSLCYEDEHFNGASRSAPLSHLAPSRRAPPTRQSDASLDVRALRAFTPLII